MNSFNHIIVKNDIVSISGHHECPEMDNLFYAIIDYQ